MTGPIDLDHLRTWIGKVEEATDLVTAREVRAMRATLGLDAGECRAGDAAPLAMHWCYLLALTSGPGSGSGGEEARFVPPVPLAQRMWAGGATEFIDPLRVGDVVTRRSEIAGVEAKSGRSGPLCFVTVNHIYSTPRGVATRDIQNLVFRDRPAPGARAAAPPGAPARTAPHSTVMQADPVMLFRYSALTHNGHRSHYDRLFATQVDGFPGLMVHGPLQAALLLEYAVRLRGAGPPKTFSHRGAAMLFEGEFTLNANPAPDGFELWTADAADVTCMTAQASW